MNIKKIILSSIYTILTVIVMILLGTLCRYLDGLFNFPVFGLVIFMLCIIVIFNAFYKSIKNKNNDRR